MKNMLNIKPGYQIHFTSSECDGDNYKTEIISGLSLEEAKFHILIASAFSWKLTVPEDIPYQVEGNSENTSRDFLLLWKYASEKYPWVGAQYFDQILPTETDMILFDTNTYEWKYLRGSQSPIAQTFLNEFMNFVTNMLSDPSDGYDTMPNFVRLMDEIKVFYVPGLIENVTDQFIQRGGLTWKVI